MGSGRITTLLALALVLGGCGDDDEPAGGGGVTVFAAASLTDAFADISTAFEASHPDVDVELAVDGSSTLVAQIIEGAPVDVFASADQANMTELVDAGRAASTPVTFARNDLAIIVAPGNPLGITGPADLASDDVTLIVCAEAVPCGAYAQAVFEQAGVTVEPASYEQNVRGVTSKVVEGEADAGIVYVTDVLAAGDRAELVELTDDLGVSAAYPVVLVADGPNPRGGSAFVEFLTGAEAQAILGQYGFGPP